MYSINKINFLRLLTLIEKLNDENVILKLICGEGDHFYYNSYFYKLGSNNEELAKKMLEIIKKSSADCRAFFFSKKFVGDIPPYDYFMKNGNFALAKLYKAAKDEFEKENPKVENKELFIDDKSQSNGKQNFQVIQNVKTNFSDVGGMFNVKKQIQEELLDIITNPNVKNEDKPNGVLLYGSPGTGKTLLAKAIAGEAKIPFVASGGSSFVEVYVGAGAMHVRELYKTARKVAANHPSKTVIVFIDEIDAVAGKRGRDSNSERESTLNQLLIELDGAASKEQDDIKIITIAATNRPDMLDDAFKRSGRMDYEFEIDDPSRSEKARLEILKVHAKNRPFKNEEEKKELLENLARATTGLSGADLAEIMKRAYRKTLKKDRTEPYITQNDITKAKLEAIVGIKKDSEQSQEMFEEVIIHEAGHAVSSVILDEFFPGRSTKTLDCIVNEPRGNAEGLTMFKPTGRDLSLTGLIMAAAVAYSGLTAEEAVYGEHFAGVSGDLKSATDMLTQGITKYGFGKKGINQLCLPTDGKVFDLFKTDIQESLANLSRTAFEISEKVVKFAKDFITQYTKKYANLPEDANKIVEGSEFLNQFKAWVQEITHSKNYEVLKKEVGEMIKMAK